MTHEELSIAKNNIKNIIMSCNIKINTKFKELSNTPLKSFNFKKASIVEGIQDTLTQLDTKIQNELIW